MWRDRFSSSSAFARASADSEHPSPEGTAPARSRTPSPPGTTSWPRRTLSRRSFGHGRFDAAAQPRAGSRWLGVGGHDSLSRQGCVSSSRLISRNLGEPVDNRPFTLLLGSTSCGIVQCEAVDASVSSRNEAVETGCHVDRYPGLSVLHRHASTLPVVDAGSAV